MFMNIVKFVLKNKNYCSGQRSFVVIKEALNNNVEKVVEAVANLVIHRKWGMYKRLKV